MAHGKTLDLMCCSIQVISVMHLALYELSQTRAIQANFKVHVESGSSCSLL